MENIDTLDHTEFEWKSDLSYVDRIINKTEKSLTDFKNIHTQICTAERTDSRKVLLHQYFRGRVLNEAREQGYNLGVPYSTEQRYITLFNLISKWPNLLICELSFAQLIKYRGRLCHTLEQNDSLSSQLGQDFCITVEDKPINLIATDEVEILTDDMNIGCDAIYHELHEETANQLEQPMEIEPADQKGDWLISF